jgi:hypothetical protein
MDRTMIKFKCKICGGEYINVCTDGLQYYHACPPITDKDEKTTERPNKRDENKKELIKVEEREIISI